MLKIYKTQKQNKLKILSRTRTRDLRFLIQQSWEEQQRTTGLPEIVKGIRNVVLKAPTTVITPARASATFSRYALLSTAEC